MTSGVLAAMALGLLGGCESDQDINPMANSYYLNPGKDLRSLGRVALVELENLSAHPELSAEVTEALYVALQKKQSFGLSLIQQDDPSWRGMYESLNSFQALRRLAAVRQTLRCNGLLVGTITQYQP